MERSPLTRRGCDGKGHGPPLGIASKRAAANRGCRRDLAVKMHFDAARHSPEVKAGSPKGNPFKLAESKAIEPALSTKAGKSWLGTVLHSTEEAGIGAVQPP